MSQPNFNNINKISIEELSPQVQLLLQLSGGNNDVLQNIYPGATKTENVGNGKIKINDVEVTVYNHPSSHPVSMITGLHSVATSGEYEQLKNKPTSLPASDVYEWAKASTKPTYTAGEIGAIPSNMKGVSGGVATLDSNAQIPIDQLSGNLYDLVNDDKLPDRQMPEIKISKLVDDSSIIIAMGGLSSSNLI